MKKKIAIIGAGGHGKVVGEIATLNKYEIIDFFDDKVNEIKNFPFTVRDTEEFLKQNLKNYNNFFVAIGNNEVRKKKVNVVKLFHPNSIVSKLSTVGEGTCVMANATINPGTVIKEGVIINTSASI